SPTSNSLNQQRFGIIINVYEPTDTTTAISLTTAQIPWWKLTTTTTQIPWWKLTTT
ncbi:unnamed protein product, partial [Rotaria magnacalcarata]